MNAFKLGFVMLGLLTLMIVGCQESFTGEWVEEGIAGQRGMEASPTGGRREAFQFDGISTVRTGAIAELGGVVDNQTLQSNQYFVFASGRSAQIGSLIATFSGGKMIVSSADGSTRRVFSRQNGPSIFPPYIQLPRLTRSNAPALEMLALAQTSISAQPWSSPLY